MRQVYEKYDQIHPIQEWRYELKVRYVPHNLNDLYEKDKITFCYYYDQVRFCLVLLFLLRCKINNIVTFMDASYYGRTPTHWIIARTRNEYDVYVYENIYGLAVFFLMPSIVTLRE